MHRAHPARYAHRSHPPDEHEDFEEFAVVDEFPQGLDVLTLSRVNDDDAALDDGIGVPQLAEVRDAMDASLRTLRSDEVRNFSLEVSGRLVKASDVWDGEQVRRGADPVPDHLALRHHGGGLLCPVGADHVREFSHAAQCGRRLGHRPLTMRASRKYERRATAMSIRRVEAAVGEKRCHSGQRSDTCCQYQGPFLRDGPFIVPALRVRRCHPLGVR